MIKFSNEQVIAIHKSLKGKGYFDILCPEKEKRTVTDVICPVCGKQLIYSQKRNSVSIECLDDGIVDTLRGF
jgi:hypothetical protein